MSTVSEAAGVARALRRAKTRARLTEMAEHAKAAWVSEADRKLGLVRSLIDAWVSWSRSYRPPQARAATALSGWMDLRPSPTTATEYLEHTDSALMQAVHHAIEEDLALYPDGVAMRLALRLRWLNERAGAAVFSQRRLAGQSADDLADRAERVLVDLLERRGVILD